MQHYILVYLGFDVGNPVQITYNTPGCSFSNLKKIKQSCNNDNNNSLLQQPQFKI